MPVSNLLNEGLGLMLLGMGSVFAFLLLLILTMNFVSRLVKLFPQEEEKLPHHARPVMANKPITEADLVAVITASINRYKIDKSI